MTPHVLTRREDSEDRASSLARPGLSVIATPKVEFPDLDLHPSAEVYAHLHRPEAATRPRFTKPAIASLDAGAVLVSIYLARLLAGGRLAYGGQPGSFKLAAATLPIWALALAHQSLYKSRRISRGIDETGRIINAVFTAVGGIAIVSVIAKIDLSRVWLMLVLLFGIVSLTTERFVLRLWFRRSRREGRMMRKVMILGKNDEGRAVYENLVTDPSLGYEVMGFIEDHMGDMAMTPGAVLSHLEHVGAQGVIIAATSIDLNTSNHLIRGLTEAGIHVELSSTLCDISHDRLTVRPLGRFPMVYIEPVRRSGWRIMAKRGFDIVVAATLLVISAPIIVACCVIVRCTSPGPMFFRQTRVGRNGDTFSLFKIRSMYRDAEARLGELAHLNEVTGPLFKIRNDPRITPIGRILRRTSLDELPQLVNVLRGEMSLVGPRPALPTEASQWHPSLRSRLRVRPGITGMWQVHGRGSDGSDYAQLDLFYVDNWSLVADLSIIVRTVPVVLLHRGAF
jgi:exopolysaccharide biosynthesis polyprenyl glycosylphosphotransferase